MFLALLRVEFRLHGNSSLKDKRRVAQSLKQNLRGKFNVAVSEVGNEENMHVLSLAVVSVSNSHRHLESRLRLCLNFIQSSCAEELVYDDLEIIGTE